jgi:hypothetical protein
VKRAVRFLNFHRRPSVTPAFFPIQEPTQSVRAVSTGVTVARRFTTFRQLIEDGLHVCCLLGQDAVLCYSNGKSGKVKTTPLCDSLKERASDIKPKNISIDPLSRAFAGKELDRVQVYAFAMHMQAPASVASGSVTILSRPSLASIASGSGYSGSTAWHGAFRFRQHLTGLKAESGEEPGSRQDSR